jgi:copper(I)-binding protein
MENHMRLLLSITLAILLLTGTAFATPVIKVEHPVHNFGTITQGNKLDHTFIIRNSGDSPLKIVNIRPACGCTAANATVPLVSPGKSSEVKVTFNSANFFGTVTKTIAVETNDPKTPVYTLTLTGTVAEEIAVNPKQLNLGQVKAGNTKSVSLTLENRGAKTIRIISVKTPMPQVVIRTGKNILKTGESATITVNITPRTEDKMLSGYLSIITDNPTKPEIMVPVYGSPTR